MPLAKSAEDVAFILGIIQQLDETIRQLDVMEVAKRQYLGEARVEELQELWAKQIPEDEEEAFKLGMDFKDKEMIWVWARLERAHSARVNAGREYMIAESVDGDKKDDEKTPENEDE